jgi:sec-independent protein translocase protein TatC
LEKAISLVLLDAMKAVATLAPGGDRPNERRMTFFQHLEELRQRLRIVLAVALVFFTLFLTVGAGTIVVSSTRIPMLVPAIGPRESPLASQFFVALKSFLVPAQVEGQPVEFQFRAPWDGIVVQIKAALFLAVLFSAPLTAYEVGRFVGPALKPSERRLIFRVTLPILLLFLAGVLLCFVVVLPFTFRLLFTYQTTLGATRLILFADDFISFVLLFMIAFGLSFELPVLMYGLSTIGIVPSSFWKKNWRIATIAIFVFGALITPDASGITMMFVALPMLGLYVLGYAASVRVERRRRSNENLITPTAP